MESSKLNTKKSNSPLQSKRSHHHHHHHNNQHSSQHHRHLHQQHLNSTNSTPSSSSSSFPSPSSTSHSHKRETTKTFGAVALAWIASFCHPFVVLLRWAYFICLLPLRTIYSTLRPRNNRAKRLFQEAMKTANSYDEWYEIATEYDKLEGNDAWALNDDSPHYDVHIIRMRLGQLRAARLSQDRQQMMFLLRACLQRNYGGIDNPKLSTVSLVGTKRLIQEYNDEVVRHILEISQCSNKVIDLLAKERFFHDTRQSFGRSALLLSGGASLGMIHFGVVKGLFEFGLLPRIISGGSIGAIVAAFLGTHTDSELPAFFKPNAINFSAFNKLGKGSARRKIVRLLTQGVIMDVSKLDDFIRRNIGDVTFQEAYRRTGRVINITVASTQRYEMPRLLNYLTAPNVCIWSAATASCAAPFLYSPVDLLAKNQNGEIVLWNPSIHKWGDGTLENDLPMARLAELFNVNQFIVSQVNPHVVPFMRSTKKSFRFSKWREWCKSLLLSEIQHRILQFVEVGLFPKMAQPILTQRYQGDMTIVPELGINELIRIFSNPNEEDLQYFLKLGERCTWPYIPIIQSRLKVELTIDACLQQVRAARKGVVAQPEDLPQHLLDAASQSRLHSRRPTM